MTTCPSVNPRVVFYRQFYFLIFFFFGGGGGEGLALAWFESQCVLYQSCVILLSDYSRSLSCSEHFSMSNVYSYIVK